MFQARQPRRSMTIEEHILEFIARVNDAYVSSHTVHDLINDPEYQKLAIKHGQAAGQPLGSRHILPGYWFTVFVAPYETLLRLRDAVEVEKERQEERLGSESSGSKDIIAAVGKFKHSYHDSLIESVEEFAGKLDKLIDDVDPLVRKDQNASPKKKSIKRFVNSVATGSYKFIEDENGDMACTFYDHDQSTEQCFETSIKVGVFNKFCLDIVKQMVEILWPLVDGHKKIGEEVSDMLIAEVFWQHID